ncbi:unnamed protein product [Adineta steineri]|uniref:Uncharacterized protein n=1 Tax=Adineta steineri TaxID=433720 RepID=A0A813YL91_9BILA|nr:unnamed protein product [Adineta steineri]CAF0885817.1 unnamed protein product [Adineta steineri]CAF1164221.1 unnamed protein product [Adineta steineri]
MVTFVLLGAILFCTLSDVLSSPNIDKIYHGPYVARLMGNNSIDFVSKNVLGPLEFRFNPNSHINGWWCVKMDEITPGWSNNYLCTNKDIGLVWRAHRDQCQPNLKCTATVEPLDPQVWWWQDNALCLPVTSNVELVWSYCGTLPQMSCVHMFDSVSPAPFLDNYLCWKEY